ncbi:MAG TPA: Uma2 family endonuclease [Thermoanaerobaculia bacterium]|nr:Uma2 family endonuclease [Thermoanaerobaculia bacterium]
MVREANADLREGMSLLPTEAVFGLKVDRLGPIRAGEFERWSQGEEDPLELIEGWLLPMTPGTYDTGKVLGQLFSLLAPLVQAKGWSMSLDARHRLPQPPDTVVFPDLVIHCAAEVSYAPGTETVARVPEIVVEILGRETAARDRAPRGAKFLAYQMSGVQEYYFAWPDGRGAAGFPRREGRFAAAPQEPDGFFASPLLGVALRLVPAALRRPATSPSPAG